MTKRQVGIGIMSALIVYTPVLYAGEISLSKNQLTIQEGVQAFDVQLSISEDEIYAGAEVGVDLPQGLSLTRVTYGIEEEYMNVGPVQNSAGTYYFGYFDGENKFSGDYTLTLSLEKTDATIKEATINVSALNITRLDANQNVQTNRQVVNKPVQVSFEQAQVVTEPIIVEPSTEQVVEKPATPAKQPQKEVAAPAPLVAEKEEVPTEEVTTTPEEVEPIEDAEKIVIETVVEKEVVEVEAPIPYGKIALGTFIIAVLTFIIGRFSKRDKPFVQKENTHDQEL